jgi:MFS superfamily sulfate permease-like transporter
MNVINPWFGGIPTCHGSGGLAGHYTFGGRTGGSVVIYGAMYLVLGLFFGGSFQHVIEVFPRPVLGVMLAFEGLAMLVLVRDIAGERRDLLIAVLVGLMAVGLPYGYLIGLVVGTALVYLWRNQRRLE